MSEFSAISYILLVGVACCGLVWDVGINEEGKEVKERQGIRE